MTMKKVSIGLNGAVVTQADLETGMRAAVKAGFTHYEPRIPALRTYLSSNSPKDLTRLKNTIGIRWLPLNALEDAIFPSNPLAFQIIAEKTFNLAASVDILMVIVVPSRSMKKERKVSQAAKELTKLNQLAKEHKVKLALEFLGFRDRVLHSLKEAQEVARWAEVPLVLDTFHLVVSGTQPDEIMELSTHEIALVHLSDAITQGKAVAELQDKDRVLPGEGELPLLDMLQAICGTGYKGPFSVEVFHPKYSKLDPFEVAREAYQRADELLKKAR
jgi:sugar phosphate isomerase/epimerase